MAIKMRNNNQQNAICCDCKATANQSLGMFDICIGGAISTLCDSCVKELFDKTLKATCSIDHKVKKPHDMEIIRRRKAKGYR